MGAGRRLRRGGRDLERSVTLLHVFLLASAVICAETRSPLEAAIVGLADAFDAMTTDRPYSEARPLGEAIEEIIRNRGTQFAPALVDAFIAIVRRWPEVFGPDPRPDELVSV